MSEFPTQRQEPCDDWYDVPSDEMTLEQARQAVKDLRKKLVEYLEQESTTKNDLTVDCISRKSIKQKLQEHHDFFVNAYGGFSNLPQNDKSRVDEIINCIAMVVNEPSVTPQEPKWIPVSERLPEYMDAVLTWDGGAFCVEKRIPYILDAFDEPIKSDWWVGDEYDADKSGYYPNLRDGAPIAWMPLPQPYKEVEV